ncbi:DUF1801 domain-containing protein [Hymenobacter saemangeumensis]|uniref:DUF1801 domain-containing protein n=1 Tax=Hymenobacter saemangeumensis TaxID=1084522 RepID=A0ABP8IAZ8_9BACT
MPNPKPATISEYIAGCPPGLRPRLEQVRALIRQVAPDAEESISYAMPTFKLHQKPLAYVAAFQHHLGFYPAPVGIEAFKDELARYKIGKGSVQFPHSQPLPEELIKRMVTFRARQNAEQSRQK